MRLSISDITYGTVSSTEAADLATEVGCSGVGLWEATLGDTPVARAASYLGELGLGVSNVVPVDNTVFPTTMSPQPTDPEVRVGALLRRIEALAILEPESIVVLTGIPPPSTSRRDALDLCRRHVETLGRRASSLGTTLAVEPIHPDYAGDWSMLDTFSESVAFVESLEAPVGVLVDTWHLADEPDVAATIADHIELVAGVQVADWREPTRSWADRTFPGEGSRGLALARAVRSAGFAGTLDVEVFSDDGRIAQALPGSLWALDNREIAQRSVRALGEG